jgi:hypothetical protein
MFTENDITQIENKCITLMQVTAQVNRIKNGMSYSNLVSAATIGKGIASYTKNEIEEYIKLYDSKQNDINIVKFVPASGAASRMFKFLFQFLNNYKPNEGIEAYADRTGDKLINTFVSGLENFPFYENVIGKAKALNPNFDSLSKDEAILEFVKTMLNEEGLNYSFLPKGLLPFHKYQDGAVTAFREHLLESTLYASSNQKANLHFTVSDKHHSYFNSELDKIRKNLEESTNTTINVSFSYQKE